MLGHAQNLVYITTENISTIFTMPHTGATSLYEQQMPGKQFKSKYHAFNSSELTGSTHYIKKDQT